MAFALVASVSVGGTPTGGTTGAIDTTGANLLVVVVSSYAGSAAPTLTDSKVNTWLPLTASAAGNTRCQIYYCIPTSVGSAHTFTIDGSESYSSICVSAWSGGHATAVLGGTQNGATASGVTTLATGSVTPDQDNCLVIAGVSTDPGTAHTLAAYTEAPASVDYLAGNHEGCGSAYLNQGAAAATNPSWTWTGSSDASVRIAWFIPAVTGVTALDGFPARFRSQPTPLTKLPGGAFRRPFIQAAYQSAYIAPPGFMPAWAQGSNVIIMPERAE